MASSVSVARPLSLFSRISTEGGCRKRKRALRSVFLTCLTPWKAETNQPFVSKLSKVAFHVAELSLASTHLHLNVQNAAPAPVPHVLDRLHAGAVEIAAELRVLDKPIGLDQLCEVVARDEVVLAAVLLAGARVAGGVRNAEAVAVGVLGEEALEEGGLAGA